MAQGNVAGSPKDIAELETLRQSISPTAKYLPEKKKNGALKRLVKLTKRKSRTYKAAPEEEKVIRARMARQYPNAGTQRTQQVSSSLKQAGLTAEEIARMR